MSYTRHMTDDRIIYLLSTSIGVSIFVADLVCDHLIGMDCALWIGYLPLILLAFYSSDKRLAQIIAAVATVAIIVDYLLSPRGLMSHWHSPFNRLVGIASLWGGSLLVSKFKAIQTTLQRQNQALQESEQRFQRTQSELLKAKLEADAANRAKTNFLANMSHEIRTPLGAILGFSELLLAEDLTPSESLNYLTTIRRNGKLLSQIIDDILDLSKVEAGYLEIEKLEIHLPDLLEDINATLGLRASEKGIRFSISNRGAIPQKIASDPTRLKQILFNIIGNAIKFTERGAIDVTIGLCHEDLLEFLVRDTGLGMDPGQAERIFEPFIQSDSSTTRKYGGTGLGLALSRRLAKSLGGNVTLLESVPGRGSTFRITINPGAMEATHLIDRLEIKKKTIEETSRISGIRLDGLRILVVEDAYDNQILVGQILRSAGATVSSANNGREGLERALKNQYDLILMDIQMPEMDGLEATRKLREQGVKIPILALTAHALSEEKERCRLAGCDDHIAKPIDRSILLERIFEFLKTSPKIPQSSPSPTPSKILDGLKLLLAEDSADSQFLLSRVLKHYGAKVDVANNGREAVTMALSYHYDVILMDVQMPEMDGHKATEKLRQEGSQVPVIALTGFDLKGDNAVGPVFDDYLLKPVERTTLIEKLKNVTRH